MKDDVYPIGLKLLGRPCLVVGAGAELWPRTRALLDAGAQVRVVSETPAEEVREAALRGELTLATRGVLDTDFDGVWLAVLTDQDEALARRLAEVAEARRVFFCAVDQPSHSTYSHLALSRSGPLVVAISTNGRAPALARRLREEIDRLLSGVDVPGFIDDLAALRARTHGAERRRVLSEAVARVAIEGKLVLGREP